MIAQSHDDAEAPLSLTDFVVDAGVAIKWYVPEIHERGEAVLGSRPTCCTSPNFFSRSLATSCGRRLDC